MKFLKFFKYLFLCIILVLTMFPIIYTICASFKTNAEILSHPEYILPRKLTFDNYITAWNSPEFDVKRLLWNSTYYTLINVVIALISSAMGGYVFARGHFPFKRTIFAMFSALMFLNLGTITVYPLFNILNVLHLNKSLWGLIVIKIFGVGIINIYLVRSYVTSLPKELDEAAKIDGCSFMGIFFKIIAPLLLPIFATIGILAFQNSWNEYLMPTIFTLGVPNQRTLIAGVVALKSSGGAATSWNLMLAGSAISLVPVLIAYAFGNKYFIAGLSSGAVKG